MQMRCLNMARITFLIIVCFTRQCFSVQIRLFKDNFRMPNALIIKPVRSLLDCAAHFVNNKSSQTFNFYKDGNSCELSERFPEEDSEQSDGWKVYSTIDYNYYISSTRASWDVAKTACENMSARLVIIDDESEQALLEGIIGADPEHWIGLQCSGTDPPYCTWIDGRPMEGGYTNWCPGEPQDRICVWMGYCGYMWDDHFCNVQNYFICEFL